METHDYYAGRLLTLEEEIEEPVRTEMQQHTAWFWLKNIRGVAEVSAACVVGHIDIARPRHVSSLWRYAGYGVDPETGQRDRPTKGKKLVYNRKLKSMVYRLMTNQIRLNGPYAQIYRNAKHTYLTTRGPDSGLDTKHPDFWSLKHCDEAARRKASKIFLSHLYQVWRTAEGLPTDSPWIMEHGRSGHALIDPFDFTGQERPAGFPTREEQEAQWRRDAGR
jgi:hypothetical protein